MDYGLYIKAILALILVLSMLLLLSYGLKKLGLQNRFAYKTTTHPRLSILETKTIDPRRKLLLIRRDDKEHLLLLSSNGEVVIEQGIISTAERSNPIEGNDENSG